MYALGTGPRPETGLTRVRMFVFICDKSLWAVEVADNDNSLMGRENGDLVTLLVQPVGGVHLHGFHCA
jgi:hypothetical protein